MGTFTFGDVLMAGAIGAAAAAGATSYAYPQIRETINTSELIRDASFSSIHTYWSTQGSIVIKPEWVEIRNVLCLRIRTYKGSQRTGLQLGERTYAQIPARLKFDDRGYMFPC